MTAMEEQSSHKLNDLFLGQPCQSRKRSWGTKDLWRGPGDQQPSFVCSFQKIEVPAHFGVRCSSVFTGQIVCPGDRRWIRSLGNLRKANLLVCFNVVWIGYAGLSF